MKKSKRKPIQLCPTDKEYKMFRFYDINVATFTYNLSSGFELMAHAIRNGSWQLVDLEVLRDTIDQDFQYLLIRKRYEGLVLWSNHALTYDDNGFHLDGHDFETLDEVEKAMENKAFL